MQHNRKINSEEKVKKKSWRMNELSCEQLSNDSYILFVLVFGFGGDDDFDEILVCVGLFAGGSIMILTVDFCSIIVHLWIKEISMMKML